MSLTTLQFQTPQALAEYKRKLALVATSMNLRDLTLTVDFSDEQIETAKKNFSATIVGSPLIADMKASTDNQ